MLIILDRDGVINEESHEYIKSPEEWVPIPGSIAAIAKLKQAGFTVAVATNQSGIARGLYTETTLAEIHKKMSAELAKWGESFDLIVYCPHLPDDYCQCRKPQAGLYKKIAAALNMPLNQAICIGDSLRDLQAAESVEAKPMLVLTGNGEQTVRKLSGSHIPVYANLAAAVDAIVSVKS